VITHFKDIRAPLFVLQGDNDTRIPKEESGRLADILKKQGNVVDAVFHPEEGRGFDKLENWIDSARRLAAWFDRYLKYAPAAPAASK